MPLIPAMAIAIQKTMGAREWAMLVALGLIWGGSFYFYAIAITELPTFTIVLLRVGIGALGLWTVVALAGLAPPRDWATWRDFFLMGLLNNAIPFSLIVWGQHQVASVSPPFSTQRRPSSRSSSPTFSPPMRNCPGTASADRSSALPGWR